MAVTRYNRDGKVVKNGVRSFSGNDSSARKYVAKDVVVNNETSGAGVVSNLDHIVNQAAGLKVVSLVADQAVALGRAALLSVRDELARVVAEESSDVRSPVRNFTDTDVQIAHDAFVRQITSGVQKFNSKIDKRVGQAATSVMSTGASSFLTKTKKGDARASQNNSFPEIDHVLVELDKRKGTVDAFYTRVTFTLPKSDVASGKIKAVRVMRSSVTNPDLLRRVNFVSFNGLDRLVSSDTRTRSKNSDHVSALDIRLQEGDAVSAVSFHNPVDPSTNSRVASNSGSDGLSSVADVRGSDPSVGTNVSSFVSSERFGGLDRSVSLDLNTIRNIGLQNPDLTKRAHVSDPGTVGGSAGHDPRMGPEQVRQARAASPGASSLIVSKNNQQEFQEIGNFAPDVLKSKSIGAHGEFLEYEFDDPSVIYGRTYRYYVTTVDADMREGLRSKIVEVQTDGLRVPPFPSSVSAAVVNRFLALTINVDDMLVERFEIYRREDDPGFRKDLRRSVRLINGSRGFTVENDERLRLQNGFIQVGEVVNGSKTFGATFYDRTVIPGLTYTYRVYSVDIFGNKSEAPREFSFFVTDLENRTTGLSKPNMLSEVDAFTGNVKLTFRCDDARVKWLFLGRRDLTLHQKEFAPPHQVNMVRLGAGTDTFVLSGTLQSTNARGGFLDVVLSDVNRYVLDERNGTSAWVGWTGVFESTGKDFTFVDRATRIDHTYQYRMHGVDRFGNKTSAEVTPPLFVFSSPLASAPVNFSGSVRASAGTVTGVELTWADGNKTFTSEDLVGNQTVLSDSSVRTLFQLQRRRFGEERWLSYPMVSGTTFFDPASVSGSVSPSFRPSFVEVGQTYAYRVQAFLSGNFVSNMTAPVEVFVGLPALAPANFRAQPSDPKVRPAYVMLSWDTEASSGVIDRWEIQRASVNNVFADRMNSSNPREFESLPFKPYRTVFRESSRFQSRTLDGQGLPSPFSGQHGFMDMMVSFGNTYFYRIRSVGIDDSASDWSFRGSKLTDESFEKKLTSIISPKEARDLSTIRGPVSIRGGLLQPSIYSALSGFALLPQFSNPTAVSPTSVAPASQIDPSDPRASFVSEPPSPGKNIDPSNPRASFVSSPFSTLK